MEYEENLIQPYRHCLTFFMKSNGEKFLSQTVTTLRKVTFREGN